MAQEKEEEVKYHPNARRGRLNERNVLEEKETVMMIARQSLKTWGTERRGEFPGFSNHRLQQLGRNLRVYLEEKGDYASTMQSTVPCRKSRAAPREKRSEKKRGRRRLGPNKSERLRPVEESWRRRRLLQHGGGRL